MTAILSRVAAAEGLSVLELRLLAILRARPLGPTELSQRLSVEQASLAHAVEAVAARGLIAGAAHTPGRRSTELALTDAGCRVAERSLAEVARRTSPRLAVLLAADQAVLARLLARLLE